MNKANTAKENKVKYAFVYDYKHKCIGPCSSMLSADRERFVVLPFVTIDDPASPLGEQAKKYSLNIYWIFVEFQEIMLNISLGLPFETIAESFF